MSKLRRRINYEMMWNDLKNNYIHNIELSDEDVGKVYIDDLKQFMEELEDDYEY